jgi:hypothetical protein
VYSIPLNVKFFNPYFNFCFLHKDSVICLWLREVGLEHFWIMNLFPLLECFMLCNAATTPTRTRPYLNTHYCGAINYFVQNTIVCYLFGNQHTNYVVTKLTEIVGINLPYPGRFVQIFKSKIQSFSLYMKCLHVLINHFCHYLMVGQTQFIYPIRKLK